MIKRLLNYAFKRLLLFGDNSNIHGLRFVTEKNRHWTCRLFWLIALSGCSWGLLEILKGTLKSAYQDTLSFTPDTNRLNWNTNFPSVTVCEKYLYHQTLRTLNNLFPEFMNQYDYNYRKMFAEMCFGEKGCSLCNTGCGTEVNCSMDWRSIANQVRQPCSGLIHSCQWQDLTLDCCKYFLPIDSEFGTCYSFNTFQSRLSHTVPTFRSNRSTGPGSLTFFIYKDVDVYVHSNEDIPWSKSDVDMQFVASDSVDFIFEVIEIANDPEVREMSLEMRKCRFDDEKLTSELNTPFKLYAYSVCMLTCETELIYQQCKCVHHLRDNIYKNITCNYKGLGCLALYAENRKKISNEESQKLCSHCLPSCEEVELTRVFLSSEYELDDETSRVTVRMNRLPNIQYRRNVVRTNLDLVVSIGGLIGLFFGASLLSIVEALYIILLRRPKTQ